MTRLVKNSKPCTLQDVEHDVLWLSDALEGVITQLDDIWVHHNTQKEDGTEICIDSCLIAVSECVRSISRHMADIADRLDFPGSAEVTIPA